MKRYKVFLVLLALPFIFTGCSSPINVSDMAIIQAVGVDSKGSEISISAQYLNLAKSTGATDTMSENITSVAKGSANDISTAVVQTSLDISNPIFFGQNKLIVLGSSYAKHDIGNTLDYLLRGVDSRPDVLVAMSEKDAVDIVSNPERKAKIPAENIYNLLKNGEKNGIGACVTVIDVLDGYSDETTDYILPVLKANDDFVTVSGLAIFSDNKYATTLTNRQTLGLLMVNNRVENAAIVIRDNKLGDVGVNISKCKNKNTISRDNSTIYFTSDIDLKFVLNDVKQGITNKITPEDSRRIEHILANRVKALCIEAVGTCLDNKADPFMIGKYLAKYDNSYYNEVKSNWHERLGDVVYTANVKTELELISDNSVS